MPGDALWTPGRPRPGHRSSPAGGAHAGRQTGADHRGANRTRQCSEGKAEPTLKPQPCPRSGGDRLSKAGCLWVNQHVAVNKVPPTRECKLRVAGAHSVCMLARQPFSSKLHVTLSRGHPSHRGSGRGLEPGHAEIGEPSPWEDPCSSCLWCAPLARLGPGILAEVFLR